MRRHPSWDAPCSPSPASGELDSQLGALSCFSPTSSAARRPRALTADANALGLFYSDQGNTPSPPCMLRSISQESSMASLLRASTENASLLHGESDHSFGYSHNSVSATPMGTGHVGPKPKKKRVRIKTERRREQCRRNQARYRKRQKLSAVQLEQTVEQLRDEVEQLQHQHHEALHRASPLSSSPRAASPEDVLVQFYHVFRFGLNVGRDESSLSPRRPLPALEDQVAFVTAAFDPDLQVGDARGRALFLEQTRRFSTLFDALELTPGRVQQPFTNPESIQTTFELHLKVSPSTLRHVFPHLVRAEHHQLRWKLLGQQLRCAGSAVLLFNAQGRVAQLDWSLDLVAALQAVLTIEETARVLQHAQLEQDAYLLASGEERHHATSPSSRHALRGGVSAGTLPRDVAFGIARDGGRCWDPCAGDTFATV